MNTPSSAYMNRIRDSTFFLIIVLAAIFVAGGYFLLEDKNRLIETTQKELRGLEQQRDMMLRLLTAHVSDMPAILNDIRDVGDSSTLILDPEMASYYLMEITTNVLPPMIANNLINNTAQQAILRDELIRSINIVQRYAPIYAPHVTLNTTHDYMVLYNQSADLLAILLNQRIQDNKNGRVLTIFFLLGLYCFVVIVGYYAFRNQVQKQEVIAARELKHLLGKLEKTNAELEHFAYVASHDLKEPLRTVASFAKLFEQKYGELVDSTGREYLTIMINASIRMQRMVSDLLEYARIDYAASKPERFDCAAEVKLVLESLKQPIEQSGAMITTSSLPTITHHPAEFMRLMQNLISNAIKYSREGIAPRIHISCSETDDVWVFSVKDNGIGIDKKYFLKIFEPFKRLHTQNQFEGTGIGLAVCKKMVERMGGKLWLTSTPNEGSVFYFTLVKNFGYSASD